MRKSILKIYTCLGLAAGAYWIWFKMTELGLPCYYLTVHGYECPGCGLTRMVFSMLQLQFGRAFLYNSVGFFAFFAWNAVAALCWWGKIKPAKLPAVSYSLLTVTMAAFLIQGLLRNLY